MPIAFDPPTHAPHGTLPARGARSLDDDPASVDIFTQLLLAAASVQDAAAPPESSARTGHDDPPTAGDAPVLSLPLPTPLLAGATPAASTVTIVASEKIGEVRGAGSTDGRALVEALRAAQAGAASTGTASTAAATTVAAGAGAPMSTSAAAPSAPRSSQPSAAAAPAAPVPTAAAPQAATDSTPARATAPAVTSLTSALTAFVAPVAMAADKPGQTTKGVEPAPAAALQAVVPAMTQAAPAAHVDTISAPAFTPGWQDETVSKLAQIVLTRNERAELKLNPAELGPVHVRVELRADQASVQIVAASPETRSALEQSLPQLRDLLAAHGITLGQASVHDGAMQRDARAGTWSTPSSSGNPATTAGGRADAVPAFVRRADRLLDVYA